MACTKDKPENILEILRAVAKMNPEEQREFIYLAKQSLQEQQYGRGQVD